MRRFTSIFVKRDKNSDLSSSSSSTNSDQGPIPPWKSWIGAKRSLQRRPSLQPPLVVVHHDIDEDSQSEEDEDEDEDEYDQNNIRIRIQNALAVNPQPNSPFVHHPDQSMFPRSSNNPNTLNAQPSLRISMFNSHLLARLNCTALSPSELSTIASKSAPSPIIHSILPFSDIARPKISSHISSASLGIQRWISRPCFEDRFVIYTATNTGIQCRPVTSTMAIAALEYPEYLDVMVDPDFDQSSPSPEKNVSNRPPPVESDPANPSHGCPSEFSATSGKFHIPFPTIFRPYTTIFQVTSAHWRNSSTVVPSPLRIQHSPPPTKKEISTVVSPAPKATVKRVVRFAEEDDDDGIPLHLVRMKKKREDKAKFLQLEQLKRTKDEDEERKRQEQEALEMERRRLAKEKEKKEMDKALYAEVIAAARLRREGHRTGTILPSNTSNTLATSSSSASLRNSERNKPPTDSRKLSSKPPSSSLSIPRRDTSDSAYYHYQSDSSPGSSRSPSINLSPVSPNHTSRSPSMYSTHTSSSEEVRQQRSNKRSSTTPAAVASLSSAPSSYHRPPIFSYPTWSGSSQTIPQGFPSPDFVHDMPLLPPTAPFMKHNRGSKSSSPSSTSSSRRGSFNSSNELVNQLLPPQTTLTPSTSSRHHASTVIPPPSRTKPERRPTHERRSSGDSVALSLHSTQHQQRPTSTSSESQPAVSRGRSSLPSSSQYLQTPRSWPGLPLQNGLMPMSMGYSPMNAYPVLFYPAGPMPVMQNVQTGSGGGGSGNSNAWRGPLIS